MLLLVLVCASATTATITSATPSASATTATITSATPSASAYLSYCWLVVLQTTLLLLLTSATPTTSAGTDRCFCCID